MAEASHSQVCKQSTHSRSAVHSMSCRAGGMPTGRPCCRQLWLQGELKCSEAFINERMDRKAAASSDVLLRTAHKEIGAGHSMHDCCLPCRALWLPEGDECAGDAQDRAGQRGRRERGRAAAEHARDRAAHAAGQPLVSPVAAGRARRLAHPGPLPGRFFILKQADVFTAGRRHGSSFKSQATGLGSDASRRRVAFGSGSQC